MTDLLSRANVDIAINTLLDDLQPNDAIQPSDHNGLLGSILDTLANGLSTTLRTGNTTGGFAIDITDGDNIKYNKGGSFVGVLDSLTLTGSRSWDFPDNSGTIALLSDITGGDNLATADLTQTDLERVYTRSSASGVSRLKMQGTNQVLTLEDSAKIEMYNGKYNDAGAVPLITLDNNKLSFNGGGCVVQGVGAEMFIYGQFATTNQTKIQLGADLKIKSKSTRTTIINANKFRWANSDDNTGYGQILNGVFIWGGGVGSTATAIGSEGFSVQKDMLVKGSNNAVGTSGFKVTDINDNSLLDVKNNGKINASSLPTSSAGLSSGDIWNNSGVLNIV